VENSYVNENPPRQRDMYSTITIDGETKTANLNCEDCIAYKRCRVSERKISKAEANLQIFIEKPTPIPALTFFAHVKS